MWGLQAVRRRLRRRAHAVVLCYHHVATLERDPFLLTVTPERFAEQLDFLRDECSVVRLADVTSAADRQSSTRPAVAVTFDDGYADNLANAKPELERYECPATVFVCTGNVGTRREFWWDELERIFLTDTDLPERFELTIDGTPFAAAIPRALAGNDGCAVKDPGDLSGRHFIYRHLWALLRPVRVAERDRVMAELRQWAGTGQGERESYRCLAPDEVSALTANGLVEIGAHTVSHPVLARLSAAEQRAEIRESQATLSKLVGGPVESFAYPYGEEGDYDESTEAELAAAGFERACTTRPAPVRPDVSRFRIPRLVVRNWDRSEFAARLASFLRA
jgi:peptidoglycan/xylan/chitin deacetylase (PgdA/CDA1 family)